jgi:hypothetical protein
MSGVDDQNARDFKTADGCWRPGRTFSRKTAACGVRAIDFSNDRCHFDVQIRQDALNSPQLIDPVFFFYDRPSASGHQHAGIDCLSSLTGGWASDLRGSFGANSANAGSANGPRAEKV